MKHELPSLRLRLERERKRLAVPWYVLEQDYVASWVLAGISHELRSKIAFKGGTALKKCYFGEYRFSEDLDFTAVAGCPKQADLEDSLLNACQHIKRLMHEYLAVTVNFQRYTEKKSHPEGQEAFIIRVQLPWQKEPLVKVMIEITMAEAVLLPTIAKPILHNYGEQIHETINAYSLEEIVAEKLKAILQHTIKLHEQDWTRSRARDYYDLYSIFQKFGSQINLPLIKQTLLKKCELKGISFQNAEDFFEELMLNETEKTWQQWLGPLVKTLPTHKITIGSLKKQVKELLEQ